MTARERGARLFFIVLCLLATAIGFAVGEAVMIHRLRAELRRNIRVHLGYSRECRKGLCYQDEIYWAPQDSPAASGGVR
jgi:hypothetical protein